MEHVDYESNIAALESVLPEWLGHEDIAATLGATWIPTDVYEGFINSLDRDADGEVFLETHTNTWRIEVRGTRSSAAAMRLGGGGKGVWDLLTDSLHQRQTTVYVEVEGKRVRDESATLAARERQSELADQFDEWVWSDTGRCERLERIYNERFNAHVVPTFDGSHLHLPGLSDAIEPHAYQRDAAWRAVTSESGVLFRHATGAGKTLAAAIAVMERLRIGAIRKAMVVVPNHMLDEWARQVQQAYPEARVLLATREMTSVGERQRFASICALGDWDMVVISESGFGKIGLRPGTLASHLEETIGQLDAAIGASIDQGAKWTVKRIAKARERLVARREALLKADAKDVGVTFEDLGVDYLVVDELHRYKNLEIVSAIDQVGSKGSQRAEDLMAKLNWLRLRHPGRAVILGLTATPISNSVAEMHTVTRYIAPDVLDSVGIEAFDAWAALFAQTVNMFELAPEGNGYRSVARFARFHNVPEMANMYLRFCDVVTDDDIAGQRPAVVRRLHEIEPGDSMLEAMETVVARAKRIRDGQVSKEDDNMLAVATTGRLLAVDPRLVNMAPDSENKLSQAADTIARIYHETADLDFGTDVAGGVQIVFCDLGTPARDGWNAYTELRDLLAEREVADGHVRFVQEAKTDAAKARLFAETRAGRVRVLIGSTETCGVGMNVQTRVTDLHHINPPWKPAELEQRDGRAIRQGNVNKSVTIHTYVVVSSFDAYSWTILTRKAGFLAQLSHGASGRRVIDVLDVDDRVLSFEEIKAISSGNPLVLRKAELDAEQYRLIRLRAQHRSAASRARRSAQELEMGAVAARRSAANAAAIVEAMDPNAGWRDLSGAISTDAAGKLIADSVTSKRRVSLSFRGIHIDVYGRGVSFAVRRWGSGHEWNLNGNARHASQAVKQVADAFDGLLEYIEQMGHRAAKAEAEAMASGEAAQRVWPHQDRLDELAVEIAQINALLSDDQTGTDDAPVEAPLLVAA